MTSRCPSPLVETHRQPRAGLTYADMLITVLIIGVAAAAAVPRYVDTLQDYQAQAAARRIDAELEYARRLAMARSQNVSVAFSTADHTCVIAAATSMDQTHQPHRVALTDYPYRARLLSVAAGTNGTVTFNYHGRPDQGGLITVASGNRQCTVTLDGVTGKATVP